MLRSVTFATPITHPRHHVRRIADIRFRHVHCCAARPATTSEDVQRKSFDVDSFFLLLQNSQESMCKELEAWDASGSAFCRDSWSRDDGSQGLTRVLQGGSLLEKAGVNTSLVQGILTPTRAQAMRSRGRACEAGVEYRAAALSFVLHFQSPFLPTLRGDVRVFATGNEYWGGGGVDLTPFYVDVDQCAEWHRYWKTICDEFDASYYDIFSAQCNDYFFLPMRQQWRGVGGLFFDDLCLPEGELVRLHSRLLASFIDSYRPILEKHKDRPYSEEEKNFQRRRRTIYLEFNLVEDRGVRFGLGKDPARTDSIMISAPPSCIWEYGYKPKAGSPEEDSIKLLSTPPRKWC